MKIRVTIDTDDVDFSDDNSMESGIFNVDMEGVYHAWYGSHSYKVPFYDVKILECNHFYPEKIRRGLDWVCWDKLTCQDCGQKRTIEQREIDECKNPDCYCKRVDENSYIQRVMKQN